jgi:hypothetical protein
VSRSSPTDQKDAGTILARRLCPMFPQTTHFFLSQIGLGATIAAVVVEGDCVAVAPIRSR